jgi:hypothetical protein
MEAVMTKRVVDGRTQEQNGEIRRKRGDTLVRTLRKVYGMDFLQGFRSDATLTTVLKETGAASLSQLVKNKSAR